MKVVLLGLGGGTRSTLTAQGRAILAASQAVIGAPRLLEDLPPDCSRLVAVTAEDILARLQSLDCVQAAVVFSGDSGFYSGARRLLPLLREHGYEDVKVLPGLSSVQLLAARLGRPWQDWRLVSAHGIDCDAVAEVMGGRQVFFLTGGALGPAALCALLAEAGLGTLSVTVGENLSRPDETITEGTAGEMAERSFTPLSVLLTEPAPVPPRRTPGWPDEWFIRGRAPMTKQLVRAAVLAKLAVELGDVCWDIGAGTGSVSVELTAFARRVYAVERDSEACSLIRQNREKFHAWNLELIEGRAPGALEELPAPDAVFIGGSGGKMVSIVDAALAKNPRARLCVSAIALETLHAAVDALASHSIEAEITQLTVSRSKITGGLHLLMANNPIFLITRRQQHEPSLHCPA